MKGHKMETKKKKFGFTIVELLTVMSVIALLIGLLVPALNMVRRIAKDTRQRAQFHSIEAALETYAGEMEEYPDSTIRPSVNGDPTSSAPPFTVGAQHLAEALLGRDMLGFDPWTTWDAEADETNPNIYASDSPGSPKGSTDDEVTKSLDRRKGPYLSSENVEAYQLAQLYDDTMDVYPGNLDRNGTLDSAASPAPVLTDSYRVKPVFLPGGKQVKAGTPILYYRADFTSRVFENSKNGTVAVSDPCAAEGIYNSFDNEELLVLGTIMDQSKYHHFDPVSSHYTYSGSFTGRENFYDMITNPKITTQVRPYNQSKYLLMSAGFDGIFGTPDDIYNFSE